MKKKRVVIAIPVLLIGGTEIQSQTLAKVLLSTGYRVTLCCYYQYDKSMVEQFKALGADVLLLNMHRSNQRSDIFKLFRLLGKLFLTFRELHPDIVHVQYMAPGFVPILSARLAGVPTLFATVHHPGRIYGKKEKFLLRCAARLCSAFFCVSQSTEASWFGDSELFDPLRSKKEQKHYTIYNAVDISAYDRICGAVDKRELKKRLNIDGFKVVGIVGRLRYERGHITLLTAMQKVLTHCRDAVLLVVGDGPDSELLRNSAQGLGISDRVLWLGQKTKNELIELYCIFDVVAVTALYEGFGLSAIEAMAASVPVVASDADALVEVVDSGLTGFLFPVNDSQKLAEYLIDILRAPNKAKAMGDAGRKKVEAHFSLDRYEASIKAAYSLYRKE